MLSPVRVFAPNDTAMYIKLVYTYIASLIGLLLTPPSLTPCCIAPFFFFQELASDGWGGGGGAGHGGLNMVGLQCPH